ncbi:response regulator transcription factor [Thermodesulfobacteriota bacterium]
MPDKTKIKIYIVDDDASLRQALEMLLLSTGMDVLTFETAEDFLDYEFRDHNACLITDIKMKGINGFELQQKLTETGIKLPVIFLTAFDSKESREKAKKGGAAGYFRKPVDDEALLDAIHWAISLES